MREINVSEITEIVARLCIEANLFLPKSLEECIKRCRNIETNKTAVSVFEDMEENLKAAADERIPICQDTGMAVIFLEIGQDVHFVGGSLEQAVNLGVGQGYTAGYLRASIVSDPLRRVNTNDNTPAAIHIRIVDGDSVKIDVCPKGFGSENMSRLKMFTPSATERDLIDFVSEAVEIAGSNPCPPVVVGVGIGGNFETSAYLAKKALCRDVALRNPDILYENLEKQMLDRINALGIGCQGFGGDITALAVNIETAPTHIAGLPVAVNIGCHVTRHSSFML